MIKNERLNTIFCNINSTGNSYRGGTSFIISKSFIGNEKEYSITAYSNIQDEYQGSFFSDSVEELEVIKMVMFLRAVYDEINFNTKFTSLLPAVNTNELIADVVVATGYDNLIFSVVYDTFKSEINTNRRPRIQNIKISLGSGVEICTCLVRPALKFLEDLQKLLDISVLLI